MAAYPDDGLPRADLRARLIELGYPERVQDKESLWDALRNYSEADSEVPEEITADNLAAVVIALAEDRLGDLPVPSSLPLASERRFSPERRTTGTRRTPGTPRR